MFERLGWPGFGRVMASALMVGGVPVAMFLVFAATGALSPGAAWTGPLRRTIGTPPVATKLVAVCGAAMWRPGHPG